MILDSVATDVLPCWQELAHRVEACQHGRAPIAIGQMLRSTGLAVLHLQHPFGALLLRVDVSAGSCFPAPSPCGHCRSSSDQNPGR